MNDEILKSRIIQFLIGINERRFKDINSQMNMVSNGLLDSLTMFELLDCIEEEFNIEVDGADIVPENFETVEKIVQLVRKSEK